MNEITSGALAEAPRNKGIENPPQKDDSPTFGAGDIIACISADSTPSKPQVIIAKVVKLFLRRREALLAAMENTKNNLYKMSVGSNATWTEEYEAMTYPVDVTPKSDGLYRLNSSKRDIYLTSTMDWKKFTFFFYKPVSLTSITQFSFFIYIALHGEKTKKLQQKTTKTTYVPTFL